jgi:hypothetical protein
VVRVKSKQIRVASATAGATAVLAMGALTVAFSDVSAADPPEPAPPGPVSTSEITTGATVAAEDVPEAPATTLVTPSVTAEPPEGFEPAAG